MPTLTRSSLYAWICSQVRYSFSGGGRVVSPEGGIDGCHPCMRYLLGPLVSTCWSLALWNHLVWHSMQRQPLPNWFVYGVQPPDSR